MVSTPEASLFGHHSEMKAQVELLTDFGQSSKLAVVRLRQSG